MPPKALLFDFGGTLDSRGVPWKERFFRLWTEEGEKVPRGRFDRAFYAADDALVGQVPPGLSLEETAGRLARGLAAGLETADPEIASRVALRFCAESRETLRQSSEVLARLKARYRLGVVSNFYGNLEAVCDESGVGAHFSVAVDSSVIGCTKPDAGIFREALRQLDAEPSEAVFIGDSRERDMAGARALGMRHVLLAADPLSASAAGCCPGDAVISALSDLENVLAAGKIRAAGILAAGEGSRLLADGWTMAKPLVTVEGVTLIEHVLGNILAAGIETIAVIFNESERDCADFVKARFPASDIRILVKTTASSYESFREIAAMLPAGRALVSTVDAFCLRKDFLDFARRAADAPAEQTILAVTPFVADEKPLWAKVEESGRVTALGGLTGNAVTAGMYVFPERVRALPPPRGIGRLREYLAWLVERGEPVRGLSIATVVDVDRGEDVALAETLAASGAAAPAQGKEGS
ncbi:MAG TPA: HAD-IA family hydrolase [Thermoanaerobaculia bacterium]|nr:HAD-IA family hydrolase [Thermoanaerobaculia bacterium]